MTARKPRRQRRIAPSSLPRPASNDAAAVVRAPAGDAPTPTPARTAAASTHRRAAAPREHHVTNDYGYVKRDLVLVAGVGAIVLAFIVGMSQVI